MYRKCGSELERPSPVQQNCKLNAYKPEGEIAGSRKGVGCAHSTAKDADNKTATREGALLYSHFQRR